jgi:multiple sugar transport system substrate-binding protein
MKKWLSMFLALTLVLIVIAACSSGGGKDQATSGESKDSKDSKPKVLKIWSFTDELKKPITKFEEIHGVKVELTIIPHEDYPTKIKPVLDSGKGAPDIFTAEVAFLKQWVDLPYWENLSADPYNADEWKNDYVPYVYELGTDKEGNVKALSWQATPGGLFYRKSIAKETFGTDDPAEIGKMLSTWDGLFEAGEKLKAKGYRLVPNTAAIRHFAIGSEPQPWVNESNELVMTQAKLDYLDQAKKLRDLDYTALAPEWSPSWFASMNGPVSYNGGWDEVKKDAKDQTEVFAFALPTWGLHHVLKANAKDTAGDWGVTSGPSPYFWGGTWLGVYAGSQNKDLAFEFVKMMTHDEEYLKSWAKDTGDFLSHVPVVNEIKDTFSDDFLGGQNHYAFFLEQAEKIETGIVTKYDQQIDALFGDQVGQYIEGKKTKEETITEFYKLVKNAYPEIKTP